MQLGFGLSLTLPRGGASPFSPLSLFANGEQGAWFDPSDLGSMFQDAAGTTPAAYGQPVGLILDKSGNGNHASQATATARPTLGRMPVGGVRNLFIYTEDITPSRWIKTIVNDYTYGFPDPFGGNRATRWKPVFITDPGNATRSADLYQTSVDGTIGKARFSLYVKPVRIVSRYPDPPDATTADRDVYLMLHNQPKGIAFFNLRTMAVEREGDGIVTTGAVDVGGGWWRLWYTAETLAATSNGNTWISFANRTLQNNFDSFPDGDEEVHFFAPMLEVGNDIDLSAPPPPYQRVGASRYDVTEDGVQSLTYLYRDPVDDALPWTAPAGSYDIVHIPLTGPATVLTAQALSGTANILLAENTRAYLAINRRLTGAEIDALAAYYGASA